jgi:orotate phosphoribosyltransferase-like protein
VALACFLHGLSSEEIADRMRISANTVKAFLHNVMVKMGVSTRTGIATKVLGLVLSPSGRSDSRQSPQDSASIPVVDVHE